MHICKRNANLVPRRRYADKKHRKPQRAFFVDIQGGMELEDTWCDDGANHALDVPLTTNKPREVEMIHPETGLRERLFESCSAAARLTNINRTKMSRMCRAGGGRLGTYIFQYVERQHHQVHEEMTIFNCSMYPSNVVLCSSEVSALEATTNHSNELDAVEALLSMVFGYGYAAGGIK